MSYSDILLMPTYERKYFINKLSEEFQKQSEAADKARNKK